MLPKYDINSAGFVGLKIRAMGRQVFVVSSSWNFLLNLFSSVYIICPAIFKIISFYYCPLLAVILSVTFSLLF
jgi:hypothetical protein